MNKTIIFRADGNSETGLGHLYRLFGLVEIVKKHYEFVFLTKEDSTLNIFPEGYNATTIPKSINLTAEPEWINIHFSSKSHIIIADGYQFNSEYQSAIKQNGFNLMYVDDLANEAMFADIVVNHSPYIKVSDYNKQPYTHLALGTSYALLRPVFLKAAQQKRKISKIDTAFVCFGGADPFNLTVKAVKALIKIKEITHIHVVLGGAYKHADLFEIIKEDRESKVFLHKNLSETELLEVMKACDFAIAPASTILYELSCVKMPILSGYYVDNQELIYNGFLDGGAIYEGGNMKDYETKDFLNKIEPILKYKTHEYTIESQGMLFDSGIKTRHLNLIKTLC